jgi:polyisoprenoid-binding protein YceI
MAANQTLPLETAGSKVTFVGDAFLHTFQGEAKDIRGSAELNTDATPPVQKATLTFKTTALTTFNDDRDKNMRDWLKVSVHPQATFSLDKVKLVEGDISQASAQHPARFTVSGVFSLNGVKQAISGEALGWRDKNRLVVSGDTVIDTLNYGLPQVRKAFLTVGTNVKTHYQFAFTLPAEFAAK